MLQSKSKGGREKSPLWSNAETPRKVGTKERGEGKGWRRRAAGLKVKLMGLQPRVPIKQGGL